MGEYRAWDRDESPAIEVDEITDEMVERALDACGRAGGDMGPVRMRAALEAALDQRPE